MTPSVPEIVNVVQAGGHTCPICTRLKKDHSEEQAVACIQAQLAAAFGRDVGVIGP